uniref:Amino acid transporter n=1 Tax=Varanus komodoensis TaxID=61221 RepID=A0A8D2LLE6_VARKO
MPPGGLRNGLLTLSVLSVVTGCIVGFSLRTLELSELEKQYFSFPGELLMRMLKMLILPLITSSLMSGLATMDSKACGKMGIITITYYLWTTFLAVTTGIILVISIHPGAAAQKEEYTVGKVVLSSADALLDLIRNMFPSNLIEASFQQYRTVLVPVVKSSGVPKMPRKPLSFIYFVPDTRNPGIQQPVLLEITPSPEMTYRTLPGSNNEMNVLGIVIFSATIGLLLGKMGERGAPLVNVCQCLNEAVMKIVAVAVWYFPFGIVFLIAGKILEMEDPSVIGKKLGLYAMTVVTGLAIHSLCFLPLLFVLITKKNPFSFMRGILQAIRAMLMHRPKTTGSTGGSRGSSFRLAQPSTWMELPSMRQWPPYLLHRSMNMTWIWASQPQQPALGQPGFPSQLWAPLHVALSENVVDAISWGPLLMGSFMGERL